MDDLLERLAREVREFRARIREQPVAVRVRPAQIREHLEARYSFAAPVPLREAVEDVARMMRRWTVHSTHPRHFGLFNPGVSLASIAADALTALYNPQLAIWDAAPAAVEIERHALRALAPRFGLDPDASFACFTTGGAESNLSALVVALTRAHPAYAQGGVRALPAQPVVYLSEEGHRSVVKAAHIAGLGRAGVRVVACDPALRLDLGALAREVARDRAAGLAPLMVVGTAGTTGAGAIDPLGGLAALCAREGLWLHVDAAWGGAAVLSPRLAHHLAGIERADSVTCDAHKWLGVAMGAGMFFCRHAGAVAEAFAADAPYMPRGAGDARPQPFATTAQWSRRFSGLKLFLALAERGLDGYARLLDAQCALADHLRAGLRAAGWTVLNDTPLPVVCFDHPALASRADARRRVLGQLYHHQVAWIAETRLAGRAPALRACISNAETTRDDVDALLAGLDRALRVVAPNEPP